MTVTDPRRGLAAFAGIDRSQPIADAQFLQPVADRRGDAPWLVRGQNAVLAEVSGTGAAALDATMRHEWCAVLAEDDSAVRLTVDGTTLAAAGQGVLVAPPGRASLELTGAGSVTLLVRSDEPGWTDRCDNEQAYAQRHPRVAPADPWPEPVGEAGPRFYSTADFPSEPGRFGCIVRTRSFMVNFLPASDGPRDPRQLSPHHHDDFEQYSVAVEGEFVHHVRYPWLTDGTQWKDDEHVVVGSPSVTVIPPPTIHTSAGTGAGRNVLIDIFSPPRVDFSQRPGWVVNASDYPMPS